MYAMEHLNPSVAHANAQKYLLRGHSIECMLLIREGGLAAGLVECMSREQSRLANTGTRQSSININALARKPQGQACPSELQERLMRVLRAAGRPLMGSELAPKLGLFSNQARGYCSWLETNSYISRNVRKIHRTFSGATGMQKVAFWDLTAQGAAYLDSVDAARSVSGPQIR
jgi:hypothetical protein